MEERIYVQAKCECGCEVLDVEYWDNEDTFCFSQFKYAPIRYSLGRRLKFLFTGKISYNEILLSPPNAKLIADYINSNINNHDKKQVSQER